ncbi:MAG: hypothetical protein AAFY11_10855 [Cyanobacteria bacterium J06641_5]
MGRQAKRKKQRQQDRAENTAPTPAQGLHFMEQMQRQGYASDPEPADRAPELPETRPEPQI